MPGWTVREYAHVRELGSGASGRVVLGRDPDGLEVAIKYLAPGLFVDDEFRAAFRAEARLLAEVDAPNVTRLREYVETAHGAAIVMSSSRVPR